MGHPVLLYEGARGKFDQHLLLCMAASYGGWRHLDAGGAVSAAFWCEGTILAGCSLATTGAKIVLADLLAGLSTRLPRGGLWNVVDDISACMAGPAKVVQAKTVLAIKHVQKRAGELGLPLSLGKCKVITSGPGDFKKELAAKLKDTGVAVGTLVRWLL